MIVNPKVVMVVVVLIGTIWLYLNKSGKRLILTDSKPNSTVRVDVLSVSPTISLNCPNDPKAFNGMSKSTILQKAIAAGADVNNLKEIAATFELVCYGKTDIDTSKSSDSSIQGNSADSEILKNCQKDRDRYNTCLTEYNAKLAEYQNCFTCKANNGFGCELSCIEPHNSCGQYKPGILCN